MEYVLEETVSAPQKVVFGVFSDLNAAADRIDSITNLEVMSPGPIGKGTRFKETRVMFGKEATEEMEITEFDPPHTYVVEAESCGAHFSTRYTFKWEGDATRVTMTMKSRPITFFAKVMGPVMGLMMGGAMKKAMKRDHEQLREACEQLAASADA